MSSSSRALISYITRSVESYPPSPTQVVDHITRSYPHPAPKDDLRHIEIAHFPPWALDVTAFFKASQDYENVKGRWFGEHQASSRWATAIQAALPRELTHEQHLALARDFVSHVLKDHPTLWVKHEPTLNTSDGLPQPHLHLLFSERTNDGIPRTDFEYFRRYNPTYPERGGAKKDPFFTERRALNRLREAWADLSNYHLTLAGSEARIDPRSLVERGFDRESRKKTYPHRPQPPSPLREKDQEHLCAVEWWQTRLTHYDLSQPFPPQVSERMRAGSPGKWVGAEVLREKTQSTLASLTVYKTELEQEQLTLASRLYSESPLRPTESYRVDRLLTKGRTLGLPGEREVIENGAQLPTTRNRDKDRGYDL